MGGRQAVGLPTQQTPLQGSFTQHGDRLAWGPISYWEHPGVCRGLVALTEMAVGAAVSCFPCSVRSVPRCGGQPQPSLLRALSSAPGAFPLPFPACAVGGLWLAAKCILCGSVQAVPWSSAHWWKP